MADHQQKGPDGQPLDKGNIMLVVGGHEAIMKASDDTAEVSIQCKSISIGQKNTTVTSFEFSVDNIRKLQKKIVTKAVPIGWYFWSAAVTPWTVQTKNANAEVSKTQSGGDAATDAVALGVYIQCQDGGPARRRKEREQREQFTCQFNASVKLTSRKSKVASYEKRIYGNFHCSEIGSRWGLSSYIELQDMVQKASGYLRNNSVTFEVDLCVDVREMAKPGPSGTGGGGQGCEGIVLRGTTASLMNLLNNLDGNSAFSPILLNSGTIDWAHSFQIDIVETTLHAPTPRHKPDPVAQAEGLKLLVQGGYFDANTILKCKQVCHPWNTHLSSNSQYCMSCINASFCNCNNPGETVTDLAMKEAVAVNDLKEQLSGECDVCADTKSYKADQIAEKKVISQSTYLPSLPFKVQAKILQHLSTEDKKNCRFVCNDWKTVVNRHIGFGIWLNDGTASWVQESTVWFYYLAVSDMNKQLNFTKKTFALRIRILILECDRSTFEDDQEATLERNQLLLEHSIHGEADAFALFRPRTVQSIDEHNLKWLLTNSKYMTTLKFNNAALSNFSKCTKPNKPLIEGNPFNNLYALTIVVTGMEIYIMERLLNNNFPKLANFSIGFFCLKRTYTSTQYESLFLFINNHRRTLKYLEIFDPPLPPSSKAVTLKKPSEEICDCYECKSKVNPPGSVVSLVSGKKTTTATATSSSDKLKKTIKATTSTTEQSKNSNSKTQISPNSKRDKSKKEVEEMYAHKALKFQFEGAHSAQLIDLKIVFKQNVSTKWVLGNEFLQAQKQLESLSCEGMSLPLVYNMVKKNASTLTSLEVHSPLTVPLTTITSEPGSNMFHCEALRKCTNLTSLRIHSFQYFASPFANLLPPSPNPIKILELTISNDMINDQHLEYIPAKLPNLEVLVIRSKRAVADRILLKFLITCPRLTRIFLSRISQDVLDTLQQMPQIYVNDCDGDRELLEVNPTPRPDGTFPRNDVHHFLVENKNKKKKTCDGRSYGKKFCPVIPLFPVVAIFLGEKLHREKFESKIKHELEMIRLNLKSASRTSSETAVPATGAQPETGPDPNIPLSSL